MQNLSRNYK